MAGGTSEEGSAVYGEAEGVLPTREYGGAPGVPGHGQVGFM